MTRTALVLGASGRFGRHMTAALRNHGWSIETFRRDGARTLTDAAQGMDIIVNGWNPPYPDWAAQVPIFTQDIIKAAKSSGAAVLIPGNVYVYGADMPPVVGPPTSHAAQNPLGRLRVEMEASYRASGVKTVILRGGDFIDIEASGNWFDRIIAPKDKSGQLTYPGPLDQPHAWAYLPDFAEAMASLADQIDTLPTYSDFAFEGYTLTGQALADAVQQVLDTPIRVKHMGWLPLRLAQPFWPMGRCLLEMSYLWRVPHQLDGSALKARLPELRQTPLADALRRALEF